MGDNRSVSVGRDLHGVVVTGDDNVVTQQRTQLPDPAQVDIGAELAALRSRLDELGAKDGAKIARAFDDIDDELKADEPARDEIGAALERALRYAERADGFAAHVTKITPHLKAAAAWLGSNWYKLLTVVGLAV